MHEAWREIPSTGGLYEASTHGRIRSKDRIIDRLSRWGRPIKLRKTGRVLKPWADANGYAAVYICADGRRKPVNVHRLIAAAFLPGDGAGRHVNHIDGIKQNDRPENLEWCSRSENMAHARAMGLSVIDKPVIGRPVHGGAEVRFPSAKHATQAFSLGRTAVASAASGHRPTAGGYFWKYEGGDWPSLPEGFQPRSPRSPTYRAPAIAN